MQHLTVSADGGALRDLQLQALGRQFRPMQHVGDRGDEAGVGELLGRQIYVDQQVVAAGAPVGAVAAGLLQHRVAEPADQAGLLGQHDEGGRAQQTRPGVPPPGQGLHADQAPVPQRQDRLEVRHELTAVQRGRHCRGQPVPDRVLLGSDLVEHHHPARFATSPRERPMRVAQPHVRILA